MNALLAAALVCVAGFAYASEPAVVKIQNYKFVPETITVKAGGTVKWVSEEKRASHSIWFKDAGLPESDRLFHGESWQRKFDKPGTYRYTCGPHPEMNGVVQVMP